MGMTIDEAKDILTSENFAGHSISEILEARDITLDIMHKYQKIKQIAESLKTLTIDEMSNVEIQIREVLEDGNDD